jgi:hypothetical protein
MPLSRLTNTAFTEYNAVPSLKDIERMIEELQRCYGERGLDYDHIYQRKDELNE